VNLDAFTEVAGGLDHPECVALAPDGRLFAGGEAGQIYAIDEGGDVSQIGSTEGFIYGVASDANGNVYACDFGNANVSRVTPAGAVETYSSGTVDEPMRVPNYAAFDDPGALYVTDSGEWGADDGVIFRIEPGGSTSVWTRALPRFPNGCCLNADGSSLYVIESRGRSISRLPIRDDGSAGEPELVVELPGSQPDGLAMAEDGTLFVGCYRPDRIYLIPPGGQAQVWAEDPDGVVLNQPTNVAFVGEHLDRLAVSSLGGWSIMVADAGIRGLPLRMPVPVESTG
jgi:gluconolactonase